MEGYPAGSLDHSAPLLIASGLTPPADTTDLGDPRLTENAILVRSDLPSVEGQDAAVLVRYMRDCDASTLPWNGRHPRRHRFRIRMSGRTFMLPPRRARIPEGFTIDPDSISQAPPVLHSPFSPLSPISHLYPDGLIDARWLQKHQDLIPSVYLCFYSLINDPTLVTLCDSKMKTDIASIKNVLSQSGYKTRLAVVIVGENPPTSSSERIQERLESIRRGTGLDHKTFLYIPPQESEDLLVAAMDAILASLFTQSMDYYRDLGRRSKKKRGRGIAPQPTVPPTSGTSRTLSVQAWNVRYDFKTAVFAEYRQDMDAALRLYDTAYETLFGSDVWEIIPSWSPRWNEARMLADILAIRILRCTQWLGQWSTSVRRWRQHRDKINDFVERRGHGTENYGWEAWQARWATVMAQMIEKVDIIGRGSKSMTLYLDPEKALAADRLQPWDLLHHPGYWHQLAAKHIVARRKRARSIPESDRKPPDSSPTSKTSKAYAYDTYMCPGPYEEYPLDGPGVDHSTLILNSLTSARNEFQRRRQRRLSAEISLECARELMDTGDYKQALKLLQPLWDDMTFRSEGWWDISERLSWMLRSAAKRACLPSLVVAIDWELLNRNFTRNKDWEYDISKSLNGMTLESKPHVSLTEEQVLSFVTVTFAFRNEEGKAGEACPAQLVLISHAFPGSAPVVLEAVDIQFEGSIKPLKITHKEAASTRKVRNNVVFSTTPLTEDESTETPHEGDQDAVTILTGEDDLTLRPGETRVFEMGIQLREPGDAAATSFTMSLDTDAFSLEYLTRFQDSSTTDVWYAASAMKKRLSRTRSHSIHILPRPPMMDVKLVNNKSQYYTDEKIVLDIELNNAEEADAITKLDIQVFGEELPEIILKIGDRETTCVVREEKAVGASMAVGTLESTKSTQAQIILGPAKQPVEYGLSIKAFYHLVTDPATPIVQDDGYRLLIINPFEANYDLLPRLHPDPWPSLFDPSCLLDTAEGGPVHPSGLSQRWLLSTRYASFATEDLRILDLDIVILRTHGSVQCKIAKRHGIPEDGKTVSPQIMELADFEVTSRRMSLDDPPGQSSMEVSFLVKWARLDDLPGTVNTTSLPAPRLFVSGSEPRVVATVEYNPADPEVMFLTVVIENPSHHFLTFGVTMDPSNEFAFSGPKNYSLNLLPSSKRAVRYRILPYVRGAWIRPGLEVRDKYFQKVLRVLPTEGMKMDKDGVLLWVPGVDGGVEEVDGDDE